MASKNDICFGRKKLFIFDLDGTLVDSKKDLVLAIKHASERVRLPMPSDEEIEHYIALGSMSLVKEVFGQNARFEEAFQHFVDYYRSHLLDHTVPCPGVIPILDFLRGHTLTVMSNKRELFCRVILEGLSLSERFSMIVGGDTRPVKKPDPEPLFYILEKTGHASGEALMIGDSPQDILAAKAAGIHSVVVRNGFTSARVLIESNPDLHVQDMQELHQILMGSMNHET